MSASISEIICGSPSKSPSLALGIAWAYTGSIGIGISLCLKIVQRAARSSSGQKY